MKLKNYFALLLIMLQYVFYGQTLDQSYTPNEVPDSSNNWNFSGYSSLGQSFTAGMTGYLSKVAINILGITTASYQETFELKIYSGNGMGGTLLNTTSFTINNPLPLNQFQEFEINISGSVPITTGSIYTFTINPIDENSAGVSICMVADFSNFYSAGTSYFGPWDVVGYDMWFKTYVSSTPPASAPTDIVLSATSIDENVSANTTVGVLSSIDPNTGDTFTYSLVSGTGSTDNTFFNISGDNLRITNSPNFETKSSYNIRLRTTDQGGLFFEKQFTITINDIVESTTPATHLKFDGVNDYVDLTNNASLQLNQGTIEAWLKVPNTIQSSYRGIIVKQFAYGLFVRDGILIAFDWRGGQGEMITNINIADNTWHHVAITFTNNGSLNIYFDGSLVLTDNDFGINHQLNNCVIGAGDPTGSIQQLNAEIDEVRIWNTIRTVEQINTSKNCELLGSESGLVAYYKFNQGIDQSNNSSETTLNATTGSNGTLTNFTLTGATSNWLVGSTITTGNSCPVLSSNDFSADADKVILVYPNPSKGIFNVSTKENVSVKVFDLVGKQIHANEFNSGEGIIDISSYSSGIYMLQFISDKGEVSTMKLVKE